MSEAAFNKRRKQSMAVLGGITLAANAFSESGLIPHSTGDPVDFLYGCFGGLAAFYLIKPKFVKAEEFDAIAPGLPKTHPARQLYEVKQQQMRPQKTVNQPRAARRRPANSHKHHNPNASKKRRR